MTNRLKKHPQFYLNLAKRDAEKKPDQLIRSFLKEPVAHLDLYSTFIIVWTRMKYRHLKHNFKFRLQLLTEGHHDLPDFLIIGAQKCGTTSLYQYLIQHPQVLSSFTKEIKYFDLNSDKPIGWYKSHFPTTSHSSSRLITGEATPDYIFFPEIAEKIAQVMPNIKLIAIFRNPTERAYSQYKYSIWRGFEFDTFEYAIANEPERLRAAKEECQQQGTPLSSCIVYRENSYIQRGLYSLQIKPWLDVFPQEQFLFLSTEDLQQHPERTLKKITCFLNIEDYHFDTKKRYLRSPDAPEIAPQTRKKLGDMFQPHNEELFRLIEEKYSW